jgi:uncharacterized protein (TIGR00730 family)
VRPTPEESERYQALARELLLQLDELPHKDLVLRMLSSVLRMSKDGRRADLKLTAAALEEMEHAFDVLEMYVDVRKVAMFGSARTPPGNPIYQQARDLAAALVQNKFMVITGAGPGVMAAGNEGAGRENSFGMSIRLPHEGAANPFIADDVKHIDFKYFFTRKLAFVKDSHAVVLCPGGLGTLDEGFEVLTLIQTGKAQLMPIVCIHPEGSGFWDDWEAYIRGTLLNHGMISPDDLALFKVTSSIEEACREIVGFYHRYHSMRFHEGELLLRLTSPLQEHELAELNRDFRDLLSEGTIVPAQPPEERAYDATLKALPHLQLKFIPMRYGRLRQLIDRINSFPAPDVEVPPERGEGGRLPVETDRVSATAAPQAPPSPPSGS